MQLLLSAMCMALTSAVIGNAWYQKKQFYPAVVYITKSNASMAVIYIQFFAIVLMFGKLLRKIFLGTLRAAEFEHLLERFWYALTETCLAFTVFRDDFNPRFVALFTVLLFLKSFHWLAEERVDFMERSPVLGWLFHIRVASLLMVLGSLDYMLLMHAYNSTLARGPSVQLVFGFEYAILLTVVASTAIKYVLHTAEMRTDTPWENKAVFLLYTELFIGFIKVVLYVMFVGIMARFYALPMFVFRPMFFTLKNFKKAFSDVIMSRRAIRNMNTLYPDATPEELRLSDNICIICREDMVNHSKKLPCGHIFHTTCLRSWFQRQQTCPTCRLNILRAPAANSTALPRQDDNVGNINVAVPNAAAAGAVNQPANAASVNASGAADTDNAAANPVQTANVFEQFAANVGATSTLPNFAASGANIFPNFAGSPMTSPPPFMMPPPFPFVAPYAVPPPPMPPDLTSFTDEALRAMEGNERKNVEERIKLLRNIQLMLDSANVLMNNYQIVSARTPPFAAAATSAAVGIPLISTSTSSSSSGETKSPKPAATKDENPCTSAQALANTISDANHDEKPSTSTAAAVTLQHIKTTTIEKCLDIPVAKHNQVTIEDIGGEEHIDAVTPAASSATLSTGIDDACTLGDSTTDDMNELRKRRLKFLEERNTTSAE